MTSSRSGRQTTTRLYRIRNRYDDDVSREKLQLLRSFDDIRTRSCSELKQLHAALCFIRAFPDSIAHRRHAQHLLKSFEERVNKFPKVRRAMLSESGIVGSAIHYEFSYEVATWLARRVPGSVSINWDELEDSSQLDELLAHLIAASEDEYFDSGYISSKEWIDIARANVDGTDFDWLIAQLADARLAPFWSQLYNSAELPLTWDLRGATLSKSLNSAQVRSIQSRKNGMRNRIGNVKAEIMRPIEALRKVSTRTGSELIDVAMAALAVRHRETHHFNHANPKEVYLADVGDGVAIAVFGLLPAFRFPLECTMGYLILSNGVPIGYGGSSVLFRQVNTGINIFDEYRGSEAAFLWTQVMRVYHHLVGCTRFIADAYQFGGDNDDALQSGAFWFYYRLGYRPVFPLIRKLAQLETNRIHRNKNYRSNLSTLRRLASCDMHLALPGARISELFNEEWIETSSMLATKEFSNVGGVTRADSGERIARNLARDLGLRSTGAWSRSELLGYQRLAPIVASANPEVWPADAKRSMRKLLRAKGGALETDYARQLCEHAHFLSALRKKCRLAE